MRLKNRATIVGWFCIATWLLMSGAWTVWIILQLQQH